MRNSLYMFLATSFTTLLFVLPSISHSASAEQPKPSFLREMFSFEQYPKNMTELYKVDFWHQYDPLIFVSYDSIAACYEPGKIKEAEAYLKVAIFRAENKGTYGNLSNDGATIKVFVGYNYGGTEFEYEKTIEECTDAWVQKTIAKWEKESGN